MSSKITLFLITLLVAGGFITVILFTGDSTTEDFAPPISINLTDVSGDWVKGNPAATVTLIEYSDFQCPACKAFHTVVNQLVGEFGTQIRFAYRHYPLVKIHKNATLAGQAAEAAGQQGKFWEMHDLLFDHQTEWAQAGDPTNYFVGYAESLGLDVTRFTADIRSPEVSLKVATGRAEAEQLGLPGTPTFFLNGTMIDTPQTYDGFKRLIEDSLPE